MFEGLSSRFEGILRKVRGRGRLGPEDVEEFLAEVRVALLEADGPMIMLRGSTQARFISCQGVSPQVGVSNPSGHHIQDVDLITYFKLKSFQKTFEGMFGGRIACMVGNSNDRLG